MLDMEPSLPFWKASLQLQIQKRLSRPWALLTQIFRSCTHQRKPSGVNHMPSSAQPGLDLKQVLARCQVRSDNQVIATSSWAPDSDGERLWRATLSPNPEV